MKKAKILLALVAICAIFSGVTAGRLTQVNTFYKKTAAAGACNVATFLHYCTTNSGGILTKLSISPTTATNCPTIRVTVCL